MDMNIPKKRKLPIQYPIMTTYARHAYLLSILSCYRETYPWIISNYIQLCINTGYKNNWCDFYFPLPYEVRPSDTCKWIHTQKIHKNYVLQKWGSVLDFIIDNIDKNNYVSIVVDCHIIKALNKYDIRRCTEEILIFGYSNTKKVFNSIISINGVKYKTIIISYNECQSAFKSALETVNSLDITTLKYFAKCDYYFDIRNIINSVADYLTSKIPEYWIMYNCLDKKNIVCGISLYDFLHEYLLSKYNDKRNNIDMEPFYILMDHKKLMTQRLLFLYKNGYMKKNREILEYKQIEISMKKILLLVKKLQFCSNEIKLKEILSRLKDMRQKEIKILNTFIDCATRAIS